MKIINLGNRIVNNFIYPIQQGYVLIDTGYEDGFQAFLTSLAKHGLSVEDISYIFLTHAHDDHAGFLNHILKRNPNTKIILSKKAMPNLEEGKNCFRGGFTSELSLFVCKVLKYMGKGGYRFEPLKQEYRKRCLFIEEEGNKEKLEALLEARIIETPGHTPDSISLLLKNGILFVGDAAMNGLPSLHKITIWVSNKKQYYKSWLIILNLKPRKIYPGHGRPFSPILLFRNLTYVKKMKLYL